MPTAGIGASDAMQDPRNARIAVIGLGYVGLPLAVEFGRYYDTIGYDIDQRRIAYLRSGQDGNDGGEGGERAGT